MDKITLSHGSGGVLTQKLITDIFLSNFKNPFLKEMDDAAVFSLGQGDYAMTTDSFVVDPVFFPGGDIGKLAVCGTVNDLASCAAEPKYMTAGFILEEGLSFEKLEKIVRSMSRQAREAGIMIVTGDTKVVPRGKADKIFINTTGIGIVKKRLKPSCIKPGDKILINGPVAQHGLSILLSRQQFAVSSVIKSDCNPLWAIVELLLDADIDIHFMRDPTRGGISAATNEIAQMGTHSLTLHEDKIPVDKSCRHVSEILGLPLLDMANEGKMLIFVAESDAEHALKILQAHPFGRNASVIGEVLEEKKKRVYLKTIVGGLKIVGAPTGESIPRIC